MWMAFNNPYLVNWPISRQSHHVAIYTTVIVCFVILINIFGVRYANSTWSAFEFWCTAILIDGLVNVSTILAGIRRYGFIYGLCTRIHSWIRVCADQVYVIPFPSLPFLCNSSKYQWSLALFSWVSSSIWAVHPTTNALASKFSHLSFIWTGADSRDDSTGRTPVSWLVLAWSPTTLALIVSLESSPY